MGSNEKTIAEALKARERAYKQLQEGADILLEGKLYFTERALLSLVRALYTRRLEQRNDITSYQADTKLPTKQTAHRWETEAEGHKLDLKMSLDHCPGDNPELMEALDQERARILARAYAYILSPEWGRKSEEAGRDDREPG